MLKKRNQILIVFSLVVLMVLCLSINALAKTSSETIANPADTATVFTVKLGNDTVNYTWADIKGTSGKFTTFSATYAAKVNGEQATEDWSGVSLSSILADAEKQLGITLADDCIIKATAVDGYLITFTVADVDATYMVSGDPVKNYDGDTAYDNSYVRIERGTTSELSNFANIRCLTGIEIVAADGSAISIDTTPAAKKVSPTPQTILFNGNPIKMEVYNIDGYNYFKLRDVAALLNGTASQFSVDYDPAKYEMITVCGAAYTAVGGELTTGTDKSASCKASEWILKVNGVVKNAYVYSLGGNNFFKLRDLGAAFSFGVDYDASTNSAVITSSDYTAPAAVTINGVSYTYSQLAAAGAISTDYQDKYGAYTCLGVTFEQLLGEAIPTDATVTVTYSAGSGYEPDTFTGADLATAYILYTANGSAIQDADDNGIVSYVRLYNNKGLKYVQTISW